MKTVAAVFVGVVTLSLVQAQAQAPVSLVNQDFEEPGTGKISNDWGLIPGWNSDSTPTDSGVEEGWTTSGTWSGYLFNGDGSVWQTSGYSIAAGDVFSISFLSRNNWSDEGGSQVLGDLRVTLYYDDGGARNTFGLAFAVTDNATGTTEPFTFEFPAPGAAAGHEVGVEFANLTDTGATDASWLLVDEVRLVNTMAPVPEPSSLALLGLGALGVIAGRVRRRA